MNYRNNPPHGGPVKTPEQQQRETDAWTSLLCGVVVALPAIIWLIAVLSVGTAKQALWVQRGWLVPVADSVFHSPDAVGGLDAVRLTLPLGDLLIGLVVVFAAWSAAARREKAAPYWYWQRDALAAFMFAVWAIVPIPAVTGIPWWLGVLGGLSCIGVAVTIGFAGIRANRRHADRGRLIEQIAPLVGDQPKNRNLVGLAKWSQEWPTGVPGKVVIKYPNASLEHDEDRKARIIALVSRIGWGPYRLDSIDPRKHHMMLVPGADSNRAVGWPQSWQNQEYAQ